MIVKSLIFIFVLTICGQCWSQSLSQSEKEFLLFSLATNGINLAKLTNCTDDSCVNRALFPDEYKEDSRTIFVNQLRHINQLINTNATANKTPINIDFSQCGVYPACVTQPLFSNLWGFTCDQSIVVFISIIGILLSSVIIISNILIIAVTLSNKSLRKPHGYFKVSLALADLLAGAFVLPSIIHNTFTKLDINKRVYSSKEMIPLVSISEEGSAAANFFGIVGVLSTITAIFSLLCLSVDSFLSVKSPLRYRIGDLISKRSALMGVVGFWIVSLLLAMVPLFTDSVFTYALVFANFQYMPVITPIQGTTINNSPLERFPHAFTYVILVYALPFVITWVLTISTSCLSRRMLGNMREARKRSVRSEKALDKVDRDLVRTVVVILAVFTITLLPIIGTGIAVVVAPSGECNNHATILAFFLATYILIFGRFLNVIVYNVLNSEFRTACSRFLSNVCGFICCVDSFESGDSPNKKSSQLLDSSKSRTVSKSQSKETQVTTRTASGSISTTTDNRSTSLSAAVHSAKYSVSMDEDSSPTPMYNNSAFTIDETKEIRED